VPAPEAEVVVVGAGVAGAAVAYHLARRHIGPVVALEARTPASGATGRAAGIVSEQLWDRWDVEAVRATKEEYAALAARLAPSAYRINGFVRWTSNERVADALRERSTELRSWGVEVRDLDPTGLGRLLPATKVDDLRAVAFAPGDAVVAPSTLAELYVGESRRLGVDWRLASPVTALRSDGGAWNVQSRGTSVRARQVVIAAGAWSKRLLAIAGSPLPLAPYRTQAAVLDRPGGFPGGCPSFHDLDVDVYGRPEENGRLLAGDGTERVEADPETFVPTGDPNFIEHLADAFDGRLPGWTDATLVRAWAGVCVATPDRRPLIGPVPGAPGLHILAGFNGFGVMRAAGAAQQIADLLAGGVAGAEERLASVAPARFPSAVSPFAPRPGFTLQAGVDPEF
jgi:glycine/D-amino acid oxidase-like deaminating enzyme